MAMRFHELPYRLRIYILSHILVLAPLLLVMSKRRDEIDAGLLVVLLLGTILFSTWKVELTVFHAKMTLTFAAICLALLLQGVQGALLCAVVGACVGSVVRPADTGWKVRVLAPPAYRLFFNLANCVLSCILAALLFEAVKNAFAGSGRGVLLGLIAFTGSYFAVNTLGVSLAIVFQQGLRWRQVWQESFLWTAPGYFASASAAAAIQAAYSYLGSWSLLLLAPLYIVYYSYKLYMDRLRLYSEKLQSEMSHIQKLNELNRAIIASLATAIDAKDSCTSSHINRVQHYATSLARAAGLSGPEYEAVSTGALVHDIGKLGVPDHILGKPGKLTPEEFQRIQSHVTIGAEILSPIPFDFPVVDVVRSHHERWDGLGYPDGLKGEQIPIGGRIIAIVDVFDALTSDRPYRRGMSHQEALAILKEGAGKQFDPNLVALFEQILPEVLEEIRLSESCAVQTPEPQPGTIDGAFALAQIRKAAAEMAAVCDVAHSLAEKETLDQVCDVVVDRAMALLPADTAVLYLRDEEPVGRSATTWCPAPESAARRLRSSDPLELVAVAAQGKYAEKLRGMTIRMGEGVAGWVATNQQPRVNVSAALDIARRFTPEETVELSAATAVPLVHGPEVLGVLAIYTCAYSVVNEHHVHLLNILAEHAAAAIRSSRRLERQRELAYTDPLTGLANSRHLIRHLDRLTRGAAPPEALGAPPFTLVMLDLDGFKEINDTLGHLRGDELLRRVGRTLAEVARDGDVVCRYAGDEFVLLLEGVGQEHAEGVAQRVREAIDALQDPPPEDEPQTAASAAETIKIGASVGVATFPFDGLDARTLLHVADQRMYEDKFHRRKATHRVREQCAR